MSQLEVDKIIPQSGTTLTIGDSGDTVNFADGTNLSIDTNTLYIDSTNNRVGIANASPSVALDVTGDTKISSDLTVNTDTLFVDASADKVGIGTTTLTTGANLTLAGQGFLTSGADSGSIAFGSNPSYQGRIYQDNSGSDLYIENTYSSNNGDIIVKTNGSERLRVKGSGEIGIDTSSPANNLHIHTDASGEGILVKSTGNTYNDIIGDANRSGAGNNLVRFRGNWNGNAVAMIAISAGDDTTNKDDGRLEFFTSASGSSQNKRMVIEPNGNVGIAETSPQTTLHVDGTGALFESMSIDTNLSNVTSSFSRQNTGFNYRTTEGLNVTTNSNASASLNRKSDGRILDFFKNDTRKGSISIDDNGISISLGGTATANTLDDYEEGTWTPSIATAGGTLSVTYSEQTGKYTKIGNVVFYEFFIETSAFSGGTGAITFSTFPFTVQAGRGAVGLATGSRIDLGLESGAVQPLQNTSTFRVFIKNSTGTGSSNNISVFDASDWSNLNPTNIYGAGYYRTDS